MPGRVEWIEVHFHSGKRGYRAKESPSIPFVSGRRCPKCGWLCSYEDLECFRCGYPLLSRVKTPLPEGPRVRVEFSPVGNPESLPLHIYMRRMKEERSALLQGFDKLISLDLSNVDRYEHQIKAVIKALRGMGRVILADDPGLGKTIEAGLITKELVVRSIVKSVLIIAPAALLSHWEEEMRTKFGLDFVIVRDPEDWGKGDMLIASMELIRGKRHVPVLLSRRYDLLIVDEAHKIKNIKSRTFKIVDLIRKRFFLLITAMPIQNHLLDLYSLVNLIRPGFLGTPRIFRDRFLNPRNPLLPKDLGGLRTAISDILIRTKREDAGIQLPPRKVAIYRLEMGEEEKALYNGILGLLEIQGLKSMVPTLQREFCSSPRALSSTLMRMRKGKEWGEELERLADMAFGIEKGSKLIALSEIVDGYKDKIVIFTEYRGTVLWIKGFLEGMGYGASVIHGGMGHEAKMEALEDFKADKRFLICTSSGAEGIELHFCNAMVNFDIPWNPLRIEQRIGRMHRLGQRREVFIFNLVLSGTIEEEVMDLFLKKLRMFELVVGELDMVMEGMRGRMELEKAVEEAITSGMPKEVLGKIGEKFEMRRSEYEKARELRDLALG